MKVAVTGATGVIGTSAVSTLVAAGHEVVALARTPEKAQRLQELGAVPHLGGLREETLAELFAGADAVCNFATRIPVGYAGAWSRSWRANDRLRVHGVRAVVSAARSAGVRRIIQESVSFLYADQGDEWINEQSALDITPATEPATVAEAQVQDYRCGSRVGVVLRFGLITGDDAMTRWQLQAARRGRPIGMGDPDGWLHAVHTDDLGPAVLAALQAPSGVYNVGAEPVRRADHVQGYADAVGRQHVGFLGPMLRRMAGTRAEPLARSLRVSSDRFMALTGWQPNRPEFDSSWFDVVRARPPALR